MTIGLLDADIVAFRAAIAAQEMWDGALIVDPRKAINDAEISAQHWLAAAGCDEGIWCLTGPDNYRKEVAPEYKANRKAEKPLAYNDVLDNMKKHHRVIVVDRLEADDIMSILGSGALPDAVVITIDKDLQTSPIKLFNPSKDHKPRQITVAEADLYWMKQTLIGDSTDGYKGCPKIGPVKAGKLLDPLVDFWDMWEMVVQAFEDAGLDECSAIANAQMARILRAEDYRYIEKEFRIWHPMKPTWHPLVGSIDLDFLVSMNV